MDALLAKIGEIIAYFQFWFKVLVERFTWVLNWRDDAEESLSMLEETEAAATDAAVGE